MILVREYLIRTASSSAWPAIALDRLEAP